MEVKNRRSVVKELNDVWHKEHDFIEVTEWTNGEGWDIQISGKEKFSLHFTEFKEIKKLIKFLIKG
jgi:hypothetical protein